MPSRARARTETTPIPPITIDTAACTRASRRTIELTDSSASRMGSAAIEAIIRMPKAATSMSPAAIPALVRISLNPNSPPQIASR